MLSYPFLEETFTAILKESKVIQGRMVISPYFSYDLNSAVTSDMIDSLDPERKAKFPLCIMMPPKSSGNYDSDIDFKDRYNIGLLFLTGTYNTGNGDVKVPNPQVPTKSSHTIVQDWHDMKRCAKSFMQVLRRLIIDKGLNSKFSICSTPVPVIVPVTTVGNDKLSGVYLTFDATIWSGCEMEDYEAGFLDRIVLPTTDSHPEHLH